MAQRRMFSLKIINSARFLKMPTSSQLLYFHLGLNADDDGIVEGYNIMRMTNCTEDDLKILVAKQFVIVLNEDLVSYIADWQEHNLIRADRKIDSIYKDLLLQILPEVNLIDKRPRADVIKKLNDGQWTDNGQQMDSIGKDRLGKDSIGKDNKGTSPTFKPPTLEEVQAYCKERNNKVDAEQWLDHYISNGWMVGRVKMKDWKATVRKWEKSNFTKPQQQKKPGTNFTERVYDSKKLEEDWLNKSRKGGA
jgi:hypothetical protein